MKKILKGDNVLVISGAHKGKKGIVLRVQSLKEPNKKGLHSLTQVWVEGVNTRRIAKKKGSQSENDMIQERPLNISKVAYWDGDENGHTKIGFKFIEQGKKIRYCKATNKTL